MIDPTRTIDGLERDAGVFASLLGGVPVEQRTWRPSPEAWNLLEVVCHLHDEEREDFRARVRLTLEDPTAPWPPIDPPAWVRDRNYAEQDYDRVLADVLRERAASVAWLRTLVAPNWDNTYDHPKVGPVPAKRLLYNWWAHDLLHLRQIVRLRYRLLEGSVEEPLDYAGDW